MDYKQNKHMKPIFAVLLDERLIAGKNLELRVMLRPYCTG